MNPSDSGPEPSETTSPTGYEPATSSLQRLQPPHLEPHERQLPRNPPDNVQAGLPAPPLHEASSDEQRPFNGQSSPENTSEPSAPQPFDFVPRDRNGTPLPSQPTSVSSSDVLNNDQLSSMLRRVEHLENQLEISKQFKIDHVTLKNQETLW